MWTRVTSNTDTFHAVYLLPKICYEKELAAPGKIGFQKKISLWKSSCFNNCSIAALIRSLFRGNWCSRYQNWVATNVNIRKMYSTVGKMDGCEFYWNDYSTSKRTHSWNRLVFGNKHTTLERVTQTMDDCRFFRQNKCSTHEIMDDCHSFCNKKRYDTSDSPYKIGCLR